RSHAEDYRLRLGEAARGRGGKRGLPDGQRHVCRYAELYGARAGSREAEGDYHRGGHLRPGSGLIRAANRPTAVSGGDNAGYASTDAVARPGRSAPIAAEAPRRSGNDLSEVLAEGSEQTLRQCARGRRGPPAVSGRRTDPSSTD